MKTAKEMRGIVTLNKIETEWKQAINFCETVVAKKIEIATKNQNTYCCICFPNEINAYMCQGYLIHHGYRVRRMNESHVLINW